ncbi:DUF4331 domain-containing protein [Methylobacterium durans]|uniref:DUF4331 domain-containing protein n=1 Tax=Methylobacterium durans TaxID=2202825 RepID=UPI0013A54274|nr:DUF4331 domain-containing protein [Methylobacterium durans]
MSDHIDGPRQIGHSSIGPTDLFTFTSPENLSRTVLAAKVFPACGVDANFSNAINHAIVVRRAGGWGRRGCQVQDDRPEDPPLLPARCAEVWRGGRLADRARAVDPARWATLRILVSDENGASTPHTLH